MRITGSGPDVKHEREAQSRRPVHVLLLGALEFTGKWPTNPKVFDQIEG